MSSTLITVLGIIAILLVLAGLAAIFFLRKPRRSSKASYQVPSTRARTAEQELSDLGILEIRPKAASSGAEAHVDDIEIIDGDDVLEDDVTSEGDARVLEKEEFEDAVIVDEEVMIETTELVPEAAPEEAKAAEVAPVFESGLPVRVEGAADALSPRRAGVSRRETLFRFLNAVQASVDGFSACLLKRDHNGRCEIEAFVSHQPGALVSSGFELDKLFEDAAILETAVTVKEVGTRELSTEALAYYAESVAVRQVAIAPIKGAESDPAMFLLVDALAWQDLDDPWQRLMIGQYATLLGTLMSAPVTDEGEAYIKPRIRSRREIIADEMERVRAAGKPLALALIYLNQAEKIAEQGEKAIGEAEWTMADRLEKSADEARMERFGELTYGIFREEHVSEVEAWALQLQEELGREGGYFDGGVSIGIAILHDRHEGPDSFRADATEALREAFETDACTIIE